MHIFVSSLCMAPTQLQQILAPRFCIDSCNDVITQTHHTQQEPQLKG